MMPRTQDMQESLGPGDFIEVSTLPPWRHLFCSVNLFVCHSEVKRGYRIFSAFML